MRNSLLKSLVAASVLASLLGASYVASAFDGPPPGFIVHCDDGEIERCGMNEAAALERARRDFNALKGNPKPSCFNVAKISEKTWTQYTPVQRGWARITFEYDKLVLP